MTSGTDLLSRFGARIVELSFVWSASFYHLKDDIGETVNLADSMPEKVRELDAIIQRHLDEANVLVPLRNPRFNTQPILGWVVANQMELSADGGVMLIKSTGNDPFMSTTEVGRAQGPIKLAFSMRSSSSGDAQILWRTSAIKAFRAAHSAQFAIQHDGAWHDYSIELPVEGKLTHLRLDPSRGPGVIALKKLRLLDANGNSIHT